MYITLNDFCQIVLVLISFAGLLWAVWSKRK